MLNRKKAVIITFVVVMVGLWLFLMGRYVLKGEGSTENWPLLVSCDFEDGRASAWQPNDSSHWQVIERDGSIVYELTAPGEQGKLRAPTSWALLAGHDVTSFVLSGRLKCLADPANPHRDLCILFHFQDPTHFFYVHFSASSDEAHNIIGLVNGSDRIKINTEPAGKSVFRLTDNEWHHYKVSYDAERGKIEAFLDDLETPILTAVDKTLGHGLVGVGSFDDTGCFDDITLRGIEKR
ncbi:MAG: hypothetical protein WAU81_10235 [Candidatus Aminicenantales bacterium]